VADVKVIDVHTHLFPPEHGPMMLWGIDELLTYHYLVSEFFMVAPMSIDHDHFFSLSKKDQATLVWDHLFVKRTPVSEAQIGVLTTLKEFGLEKAIEERDLAAVRTFFESQALDLYYFGLLVLPPNLLRGLNRCIVGCHRIPNSMSMLSSSSQGSNTW